MTEIPFLTFEQATAAMRAKPRPYAASYRAMYSSYLGGIVRDAAAMTIPIDDHVVHRGDGIFEAVKFAGGQIYALERHLQRLERSAELAQIVLPGGLDAIRSAILQTARAAGLPNGLIRLYVTRGPGGFAANPYESTGAQTYVVITDLAPPAEAKYRDGVACLASRVPAKQGWFATVKSCNYLQNALMKKEAVDQKVDFVVSLDERGLFAEGSTENFAIVTSDGRLLTPSFSRVLRGITAVRCLELAQALVADGTLAAAGEGDVSREAAVAAREMFFWGTTIDVLPVVRFEGAAVGDGRPGPIFKRLHALLQADIAGGAGVLTPISGSARLGV